MICADVQVSIGLRRRLVPVTTAESFFGEMGSLLQKSVMVNRSLYFLFRWLTLSPHIAEYKPILEEVERILMEAGLDEEEMKKSAAAGGKSNTVGQSRNRR